MPNALNTLWKQQTPVTRQTAFLLLLVLIWFASPALGFFLLLIPSVRRPVIEAFHSGLSEPFPYLWTVVLVPVAVFACAHPVPVDDLLKHLVSGVYHFDYHRMFWGSPRLRNGDFYVGFDHLAAWVYSLVPSQWAFLPFQLGLVVGFAITLPLVVRRQMPDVHPSLAVLFAVILSALVWMLPVFSGRLVSGRPEDYMALWSVCVFLVGRKRWQPALWLAIGLFMAPMYWLSCVYFPAAFLLPVSRRYRVAAFSLLVGVFLAFWGIYSHGEWLNWLISLHTDIGDRVAGVSEDVSAGLLVESFSGGILLLLTFAALLISPRSSPGLSKDKIGWSDFFPRREALQTSLLVPALLFAWFMLPDMIRYVDVLGPIAAVLLARWLNAWKPCRSAMPALTPVVTAFALVLVFLLTGYTFHKGPMPDVHIPGYAVGDRVLTYFSAATYDTLYENPGVLVAPAMELGMTRHRIQEASVGLGHGDVSCRELHQWHVQWVVTPKTLWSSQKEPCLKLIRLNPGGMSLWSVS